MNLLDTMTNWSGSAYDTAGHNHKRNFHLRGKKHLRELADELGFTREGAKIRSCKGGIAVSGEVTLHADYLYVCISHNYAYFRVCNGRKDYSGGKNYNFDPLLLTIPSSLAIFIRNTIKHL